MEDKRDKIEEQIAYLYKKIKNLKNKIDTTPLTGRFSRGILKKYIRAIDALEEEKTRLVCLLNVVR